MCESFSKNASQVLQQHTNNKVLLGSQAALLDLLEVPQLMDTCVRNGVYDEALDLQAFMHRLGVLHPSLPVVRMLVEQVGVQVICFSNSCFWSNGLPAAGWLHVRSRPKLLL